VGKNEHARLQALLAMWFGAHEKDWGVQVVAEQRIQVAADRVRIPDVVLLPRGPQPEIIVNPPILIVEILSPDDTYASIEERAADYLAMPTSVWIIDPTTRSGRLCTPHAWTAAEKLVVPETPIFVNLPQLFKDLDEG
jgi:Uma2 family endonuclease